jgi:hypothetical protein
MSAAAVKETVALSEPFAVIDIVVSDLGRMDNLGDGIVRAVLTVNQPDQFGKPGTIERVVVARLVGSDKAMKRLALSILGSLIVGHSDADEQTIADRVGATVQ